MEAKRKHRFYRLYVPVPPRLAEAFGYTGSAKRVMFYWHAESNQMHCHDGLCDQPGDTDCWLTFIQHPNIQPALADFEFGGPGHGPIHALIMDRATDFLLAASCPAARRFVQHHARTSGDHGHLDAAYLDSEAWQTDEGAQSHSGRIMNFLTE